MAADTPNPQDERVKFTIDEDEYEYPDFSDLTLDEWSLVYEISSVTISDFAPEENKKLEKAREKKLNDPLVFKAFACVGYMRANPDADPDDAKVIVGRVKMIPFLTSMAGDEEEPAEADPPTSEPLSSEPLPDGSSERRKDDSNGSSSPPSPESSETPDDQPATIGTGG